MAKWSEAPVLDAPVEQTIERWQSAPVLENQNTGTPEQARQRSRDTLALAAKHNLDLDTVKESFEHFDGPQFTADKEPSMVGKLYDSIRDYITEKTGLFAPDISPIGGPEYREEHPVKTLARGAAYYIAATASGLSLTAADVLTNKITGDKTLAGLVARKTGFLPTEREVGAAATSEYMAEFTPVGAGVGALTKIIPAGQALKTILGAGLTFESVEAANEFGKSITENRPVDWDRISAAGGVGVIFGTGEIVVAAALSGLLPKMQETYNSASTVVEEAQVRADAVRAREFYRQNGRMPEDLMQKYVYGGAKPEVAPAVERGLEITGEAPIEVEKPPVSLIEPVKVGEPTILPTPEEQMLTDMRLKQHELAVEREKYEPEFGAPAEPPITTSVVGGMRKGMVDVQPIDKFARAKADEIVKEVKGVGKFWSDWGATARILGDQAPKVLESEYGEGGKQLAADARTIAFQSKNTARKANRIVKDTMKGLTTKEKESIGFAGRYGIDKTPPKNLIPVKGNVKLTKAFLVLQDNQDFLRQQASDVGYKIKVGKVWLPLELTGKWMPQRFNEVGLERLDAAEKEGLSNPFIRKAAEKMVADGKAATEMEALGTMLNWNNNRLRGTVGYFERVRTFDPPPEWIELNPEKILYGLNKKASMAIEAARVWGVPQTEGELDFQGARNLIAQIQNEYGKGDADMIKVWIQTNFGGLGSGVPQKFQRAIDGVRKYQSMVRIGLKIPQAIRHSPLSQGWANSFDVPTLTHAKTAYQLLSRAWNKEADRLYRDMKDLVTGQYPEMAALQNKQSKIYKLALTPIRTAVEQSQIYSAMLGRNAVERWINELAQYNEGGNIRKIWDKISNLTTDPEAYFRGLVEKYGGVNPKSDEWVDELLNTGRPLTPDELDEVAYNISVRKNFTMGIENNPMFWKTNPFIRVGLLFKTYLINYSRMVWEDAIKQGTKGNFLPFIKYLMHATLAGEVWLLTNDLLKGGDKSTISKLAKRPEKRNAWDISKNLAYDWWVGGTGGVGMLVDMFNGRIGPIQGTVKNVKEAFGNWEHPWEALQHFSVQEIGSIREVQGLLQRGKEVINGDTTYFDYRRWRDRGYEWSYNKKNPEWTQKVTAFFKGAEYEPQLQYYYAAQCLMAGDIKHASVYLTERIKDEVKAGKDKNDIITGIETAMESHSPLGHVAAKDRQDFLDQFTSQEQNAAERLQDKWTEDARDAIDKAVEDTEE